VSGLDTAGRLDPADAGHAHVHEDELRLEALQGLERRLTGIGLADRAKSGRCLDQNVRDLAERGLIIDRENRNVVLLGWVASLI
jgi:hypothetical protein